LAKKKRAKKKRKKNTIGRARLAAGGAQRYLRKLGELVPDSDTFSRDFIALVCASLIKQAQAVKKKAK